MPEPRRNAGDKRVQSALKSAIEVNLARERAITEIEDQLPGAWHSNGIIFSKSGNGTPFSNGIIFSKTGRVVLPGDELDDPRVIEQLSELDEAAFTVFTERLLRLKQVKAAAQPPEAVH